MGTMAWLCRAALACYSSPDGQSSDYAAHPPIQPSRNIRLNRYAASARFATACHPAYGLAAPPQKPME